MYNCFNFQLYRNDPVFRSIVRRMGGLQFCPPNHTNICVALLQRHINTNLDLNNNLKEQLRNILDYYRQVWIR